MTKTGPWWRSGRGVCRGEGGGGAGGGTVEDAAGTVAGVEASTHQVAFYRSCLSRTKYGCLGMMGMRASFSSS